jgi:hypothetical protein
MRIDVSFYEGVAYLTVTGDVDLATAGQFTDAGQMALGGGVCGTLRIDLGGVTFPDSTGVNALIQIRNKADLTFRRAAALTAVDMGNQTTWPSRTRAVRAGSSVVSSAASSMTFCTAAAEWRSRIRRLWTSPPITGLSWRRSRSRPTHMNLGSPSVRPTRLGSRVNQIPQTEIQQRSPERRAAGTLPADHPENCRGAAWGYRARGGGAKAV